MTPSAVFPLLFDKRRSSLLSKQKGEAPWPPISSIFLRGHSTS